MPRDRRWDFLHDLRKQPVKEWILERLAEELARDLRAWPPHGDWLDEAERARHPAAAASPLGERALRCALAVARLDLARDDEGAERAAAEGSEGLSADEAWGLRLAARWIAERCLSVKEEAEGARLSRADLVGAVRRAARLLSGGPG
ncbi:MAG TPA: hypothetical protein VFP65_02960 [Anaeromyxobacteraceae bacterium]|nr:hypothetical protein [Anaeromyxobacteraceae bacterium]